MAISLDFFKDSGLTDASDIPATQSVDGAAAAEDRVVYLGSPVAGRKFRATSNPGVDQVAVSIANAGGSLPASAVKLALSAGGLASAVAGAPLNVGTQILSGVANALPIYVRIDAPALALARYTNLSLTTNTVTEGAV